MLLVHIGHNVEFVFKAIALDGGQTDFNGLAFALVALLDNPLCFGAHGNDEMTLALDEGIDQCIVLGGDISPRGPTVVAVAGGELINHLQRAPTSSPGVRKAVDDEDIKPLRPGCGQATYALGKEKNMSTYTLAQLLTKWAKEELTAEQMIGHIVQHLIRQEEEITQLQKQIAKDARST